MRISCYLIHLSAIYVRGRRWEIQDTSCCVARGAPSAGGKGPWHGKWSIPWHVPCFVFPCGKHQKPCFQGAVSQCHNALTVSYFKRVGALDVQKAIFPVMHGSWCTHLWVGEGYGWCSLISRCNASICSHSWVRLDGTWAVWTASCFWHASSVCFLCHILKCFMWIT